MASSDGRRHCPWGHDRNGVTTDGTFSPDDGSVRGRTCVQVSGHWPPGMCWCATEFLSSSFLGRELATCEEAQPPRRIRVRGTGSVIRRLIRATYMVKNLPIPDFQWIKLTVPDDPGWRRVLSATTLPNQKTRARRLLFESRSTTQHVGFLWH
jgi:hypothetical protein